ncbi:MAG: dihydroorotase [Burkholderiaceae bacterium]|nr:MAG: dihydroorotase [Burkholderiaceae bacterium]
MEILNGLVYCNTAKKYIPKNITISSGKIQRIDVNTKSGSASSSSLKINAKNCIVTSSFTDCAVRIKEPGSEYKGTMYSELKSAVAGGITRLVCPPDTDPVLDEPGLVRMLINKSIEFEKAIVTPLGALTQRLEGHDITEMGELFEAGCIGFSQANQPIRDNQVLLNAFQYASNFDFPIWVSPRDPWIGRDGDMHSGLTCTRLGLKGVPVCAETLSLVTLLRIAEMTNARLHLCRLSSLESVDIVREAKKQGLRITADVGIHYLHLTDLDVGAFNTNCKAIPPFRGQRDRDALTEGLLDGTIDFICSDHTPVDTEDKTLPFSEASEGQIGTELLLPLTLSWAKRNKIEMHEALNLISTKAATILNKEVFRVEEGAVANVTVFGVNDSWTVEEQTLLSQGKNSPFLGYEMYGKVHATIMNGRLVFLKN